MLERESGRDGERVGEEGEEGEGGRRWVERQRGREGGRERGRESNVHVRDEDAKQRKE